MSIIIILLCLPANFHEKSHLEDLGGWHTLEIKNLWVKVIYPKHGEISRESPSFSIFEHLKACFFPLTTTNRVHKNL
jgi:hypothetical protein